MDSAKKVLDTVLYWITVVLFAFLVFALVWQVFTRQIGSPATWTEEASRMTFVWLGLFAAALVFGERGHIAVEFAARKLPAGAQRAVSSIVQLIVIAFAAVVMIWGGWSASQNAWNQQLSALPFSFGEMYLALPISGALIVLYGLYFITKVAGGRATPYPEMAEEDPVTAQPDVQEERLGDQTTVLDAGTDPPDDAPGTGPADKKPEA